MALRVCVRVLIVSVLSIFNGIPGGCHLWLPGTSQIPQFGPALESSIVAPFMALNPRMMGHPMEAMRNFHNPYTNSFTVKHSMLLGRQAKPMRYIPAVTHRMPMYPAPMRLIMPTRPLHRVGVRPGLVADMETRNVGYARSPVFARRAPARRPPLSPVIRKPYLHRPSPTAYLSGTRPTGYRLPLPTRRHLSTPDERFQAAPRSAFRLPVSRPSLTPFSPLPEVLLQPYPPVIPRARHVPSSGLPVPYNRVPPTSGVGGPSMPVPIVTNSRYDGWISNDDERLLRFYSPFDNRDAFMQMQTPYITSKHDYYKPRLLAGEGENGKTSVTLTSPVTGTMTGSGPGGAAGLIQDTIGAVTSALGAPGGSAAASQVAMTRAEFDRLDDDKQNRLLAAVSASGAGSRSIGNSNMIPVTASSLTLSQTGRRGSLANINDAVGRIATVPFKDNISIALTPPIGPGIGGIDTVVSGRKDGFNRKGLEVMAMADSMSSNIGRMGQTSVKHPVASAAMGTTVTRTLAASPTSGSKGQSAVYSLITGGASPPAAHMTSTRRTSSQVDSGISQWGAGFGLVAGGVRTDMRRGSGGLAARGIGLKKGATFNYGGSGSADLVGNIGMANDKKLLSGIKSDKQD